MISFLVLESLGDSEVDQIQFIYEIWVFVAVANHNIIRLDVIMDKSEIMEPLQKFQQLNPNWENTFNREMFPVPL